VLNRSLRQYIELYHLGGIADFFVDEKSAFAIAHDHRDISVIMDEKYILCQKCVYHKQRIKFVHSEGKQEPRLFIIGNPPTTIENMTGRSFFTDKSFGESSGSKLNKMLEAIHIERTDCFITNIIKCKPDKFDDAIAKKCLHIVSDQITTVKPKTILVFGLCAANLLFELNETIEFYRQNHKLKYKGIPTIVTYDPIEMQVKTELRKLVWEDLQKIEDRR
jgi:DNA polymerase